ncbi:hypothetical protein HY085_01255 [Candidatus Gottesmanbacteria bacterium]|nr:hypothetical protein [Candidatus Gottesmanbacteria bacterium]
MAEKETKNQSPESEKEEKGKPERQQATGSETGGQSGGKTKEEKGKAEVKSAKTDPDIEAMAEQIEQLGRQIEEKMSPLPKLENETEQAYEARAAARRQGAVEAILMQENASKEFANRLYGMSPEQQQEMGYEVPPRLEDDPQEALDWFYRRLQTLEENFYNQSFDSRWQLVSPLEQFILKLTKKSGQNLEQPFEYKGKTFTNYGELNQNLSEMLEARRSRHNHTYVFRRASGTEDLIGAAAMLDLKNIQTLLHIPEVADKLREFEKIGNEYKQRKDKDERKEKTTQALNLQESDWSGRIAGGLFSALGEAARFDIQINEGGDFFWNRIQNFSARTEGAIKDRYPTQEKGGSIDEKTQKEMIETIAPAMNLMTETFLADEIIGKDAKKEEEGKKRKLDPNLYGIGQYEVKVKNKDDKEEVKEAWLDLSNFKFENLNLSRQGKDALELSANDALKISMLDINDANGVRKAIWDPAGYIDLPTKDNVAKLFPLVKHLKGEKRAAWFKGTVNATVEFNKDRGLPIPLKPRFMSDSLSKRIFGWEPWDHDVNGAVIGSFRSAGALDRRASDELLDEHVGKIRRGLATPLEILGIIFESLKKGYEAMEKAK